MSKLDEDEIVEAQILINNMPSGNYELEKIFGDKWFSVRNPTDYGTRFKKTVELSLLSNISVGIKNTNNHRTYKISNQQTT